MCYVCAATQTRPSASTEYPGLNMFDISLTKSENIMSRVGLKSEFGTLELEGDSASAFDTMESDDGSGDQASSLASTELSTGVPQPPATGATDDSMR